MFFKSFHKGLTKTRSAFQSLLNIKTLDTDTIERIEEALLTADIEFELTQRIIESIQKKNKKQEIPLEQLFKKLEESILEVLPEISLNQPTNSSSEKPLVCLILGVNGVGKTTTIAKLAYQYQKQGKKVLLAAADTFRAGAIEQLSQWSQKLGVDIIKQEPNSSATAVVYNSYEACIARKHDVLLIDTAGRLHNKNGLMEELKKIIRTLKKHGDQLPHQNILVIDSNTGQNAIEQAKAFYKLEPITSIIVTKLDGSTKGGCVLSIMDQLQIPIHSVGVGEKVDDLIPFDPKGYIKGLFEKN